MRSNLEDEVDVEVIECKGPFVWLWASHFARVKINLEYYRQYPGVITDNVSVLTYRDEEGQRSRQGMSRESHETREREASCRMHRKSG